MSVIIDESNAIVTMEESSLSGSNDAKENSTKKVPELVLEVINDYYGKGKPAPIQNVIASRVTEIKNVGNPHEYTVESQQPLVSRALRNLVKAEKIIKTSDNRYLPYNLETGRAILKKRIIETVRFGPKRIFQMSASTWLVDVERASQARAKSLFEKYLGESCYDIFEFNGYLMLLISEEKEKRKELYEEIRTIKKEATERAKDQKNHKE